MKSSTIESCAQSILIGDRALLRHGSFLELRHGRRNWSRVFDRRWDLGGPEDVGICHRRSKPGISRQTRRAKVALSDPTVPLSTPTAMSLNRKLCHQCLSVYVSSILLL